MEQSCVWIQKFIDVGYVCVNGKIGKVKIFLCQGDEVQFWMLLLELLFYFKLELMDLDVLFEDDYLIVFNKLVGLIVYFVLGNKDGILVNGLLYYCLDLFGISGKLWLGIVYCFDKDIIGCIVIVKS